MPSTTIKPVSIYDVMRIADIAVALDEMKNRLPAEQHQELVRTVAGLHAMAEALDVQHGFGIYAADDTDAQEAA